MNMNTKEITPITPGMYRHSKSGRLYEVLSTGYHSETLEPMVVYRAQYNSPDFGDHAIWVRPAAMFNELIIIGDKKVPRFVKVSE